jgi:hypothetical protein
MTDNHLFNMLRLVALVVLGLTFFQLWAVLT